MSLTPPGDLYVGVNDAIFPKFLAAIRSQRPSLLNYLTPYFAAHPGYWCAPIPPAPNGAPKYTAVDAVKSVGNNTIPAVEYMLQVSDIAIGFGVDNVGLPNDLLPLPPQRAAVKISVNMRFAVPRLDPTSLGCPNNGQFRFAQFPLQVCDCFTATLYATGTAAILPCGTTAWITFALDRVESTNLAPPGLRDTVGYLAVLILDTLVVPSLWVKLDRQVIDLKKALPQTAPIKTITITPGVPTATPNPDISNDLVQARMTLKVSAP
jgi:hypothetical protein